MCQLFATDSGFYIAEITALNNYSFIQVTLENCPNFTIIIVCRSIQIFHTENDYCLLAALPADSTHSNSDMLLRRISYKVCRNTCSKFSRRSYTFRVLDFLVVDHVHCNHNSCCAHVRQFMLTQFMLGVFEVVFYVIIPSVPLCGVCNRRRAIQKRRTRKEKWLVIRNP